MKSTFEGMEGMTGMTSAGIAAVSSAFFADRIDLPFVTVQQPTGKSGGYSPIADNKCWIEQFSYSNWSTEWYLWLVLTEFVQAGQWNTFQLLPDWAQDGQKAAWNSAKAQVIVSSELEGLIMAARDERPDALGEILAQNSEFVSYFLNMIYAPDSHPKTARLLNIANFIAGFCAMYYKGLYKRPRPSMICPALLPPVPVPGHASFPSGHSTQAHLISLCLMDVLANRPDLQAIAPDVRALADRIARNREIAGLHFPSDTSGGVQLASCIHDLLVPLQTSGGWYQMALSDAQAEWKL